MTNDLFYLGVKGLIRNEKGELLLLKYKPEISTSRRTYWDIPGGRVEKGESITKALKREILEETGIEKISKVKKLTTVISNLRKESQDDRYGLILMIYICNPSNSSSVVLSDEHSEYGWFKLVEAAELLKIKYPEEFTRMLKNLSKGEKYL